MEDLKGKTALVTGASTGIGAAVAKAFAARGMHVAVHYNSSAGPAKEVVDAITAAGGLKTAVAEFYQVNGTFTGADSGNAGFSTALTGGISKYTAGLAVATGVITATMKGSGVASCVTGATVTLTPTAGSTQDAPISWSCSTNAAAGCRPASCVG